MYYVFCGLIIIQFFRESKFVKERKPNWPRTIYVHFNEWGFRISYQFPSECKIQVLVEVQSNEILCSFLSVSLSWNSKPKSYSRCYQPKHLLFGFLLAIINISNHYGIAMIGTMKLTSYKTACAFSSKCCVYWAMSGDDGALLFEPIVDFQWLRSENDQKDLTCPMPYAYRFGWCLECKIHNININR